MDSHDIHHASPSVADTTLTPSVTSFKTGGYSNLSISLIDTHNDINDVIIKPELNISLSEHHVQDETADSVDNSGICTAECTSSQSTDYADQGGHSTDSAAQTQNGQNERDVISEDSNEDSYQACVDPQVPVSNRFSVFNDLREPQPEPDPDPPPDKTYETPKSAHEDDDAAKKWLKTIFTDIIKLNSSKQTRRRNRDPPP